MISYLPPSSSPGAGQGWTGDPSADTKYDYSPKPCLHANRVFSEVARRDLDVHTGRNVGRESLIEHRAEILTPLDPEALSAERLDHFFVVGVVELGSDSAFLAIHHHLTASDLGPGRIVAD